MTSRERLLKCIRHQPIDRVPISTYELVGWNPEAWENQEPSYRNLMDAIREYTDCIYMLNPGFRQIPHTPHHIEQWQEGHSHFERKVFRTKSGRGLGTLSRTDENVHTVWTLEHLLEDLSDIDAYLSLPYEPAEFDLAGFNRHREALGDKGLMMISVDDPICLGAELFEMSMFLVYARTEPRRIKYFLDAIHERQMLDLKRLLGSGDFRDVIFRVCGPEYATPPYLPPECYYDYVTCYLIEICREIRQAGAIPRIHCHGKIGRVLDQFALTEAEAIDPVEPPPDGDIELGEVKKRVGDRFCLFGNLELKELETSDRSRIDLLVRKAMEEAKEGSGFVFMPTAAPINVPLSPRTEENYLQMMMSALKYGRY